LKIYLGASAEALSVNVTKKHTMRPKHRILEAVFMVLNI
jgi:hypothetical protein